MKTIDLSGIVSAGFVTGFIVAGVIAFRRKINGKRLTRKERQAWNQLVSQLEGASRER